jgi:formyltetrahydrofolate-dependent phosphoribosylglycinamide formyltransferase
MKKARTAVLISGRGSNMMALVEAAKDPAYPAQIACVVSDRAGAAGIGFAQANGIDTAIIERKDYADRNAFERSLGNILRAAETQLIALAGFMRVLSAEFVSDWEGRMINIHPSLLPAYKGLHTHERALADGAKTHGCTVHHVTAELDAGPIILQAEVPVLPDDTPETLSTRVLKEEHRIYPEALAIVARSLQPNTSI